MEANKSQGKIDMLSGSVWKKMIAFSFPLAATSILQQLFNSADVAVVGRFAGSAALAAVGANVANVGVFVNFLSGRTLFSRALSGRETRARRGKFLPLQSLLQS